MGKGKLVFYSKSSYHNLAFPIAKRMQKIRPNVFIAQPRRDNSKPLLQVVYESPWVVTPYACKTLYGTTSGLPVDVGRNSLMTYSLQVGAEYLFFVDDDVVVPFDGFQKLYHAAKYQNNLVVGGVVTGKNIEPALPMTSCVDDEGHVFIPDLSYKDGAEALVPINWMTGFACLLISTKVLKMMLEEKPNEPFCVMAIDENKNVTCGEDMWFIHRVMNLHVDVKVHRGVQCRHYDISSGKYWGGCVESKYYLNVNGEPILS